MHTPIKTWLGVTVIIILALSAGMFIWYQQKNLAVDGQPSITNPGTKQKACTEEAKLCPDGTAVGRTGPNCEFAECPGETNCAKEGESIGAVSPEAKIKQCCPGLEPVIPEKIVGTRGICRKINDQTSDWQTYRNEKYGFEFKYPSGWEYMENINIEGTLIDVGFVPKNIESYRTCKNYADDKTITDSEYWAKVLYCMVQIRVEGNKEGLALKDYLTKIYYSKEDLDSIGTINSLIIENKNGVEVARAGHYHFGYGGISPEHLSPYISAGELDEEAIVSNGKYILFIDNSVTDEQGINGSTFNQILSTFKFID